MSKKHGMKTTAKRRIAVAWMLFLVLMPFFVVKTLHHHGTCTQDVCRSADGHEHSSEEQCPICHFMLSPFTEAESLQVEVAVPVSEAEYSLYVAMPDRRCIHLFQLRAPPVVLV
jgi:hypothetical protein